MQITIKISIEALVRSLKWLYVGHMPVPSLNQHCERKKKHINNVRHMKNVTHSPIVCKCRPQ